MKLIDRHIAGRYLANVVALLAALFSFVVVVDVGLNMRDFSVAAERLRPGAGGLSKALMICFCVVDLWGPRLLQLFNHLIGVTLVVGMGFTCAQFVRHREFIAILASGVSLRRLAGPILGAGVVLLGVAALNQEFLLPRVAHLLPRSTEDAGQRTLDASALELLPDSQGRLFYASTFDPEMQTLENLSVWERDEQRRVERRITAKRATWTGSSWELDQGVAVRSADAEREPVERIETDLDPSVITVHLVKGFAENMSVREINRTLAAGGGGDAGARARLNRARFGRFAQLAGAMLALMVSMPFFLVRTPQSMIGQSLKCAPLALAALLASSLGAAQPMPGFPVAIGVFVPTLVLAPIAVWGMTSVKS